MIATQSVGYTRCRCSARRAFRCARETFYNCAPARHDRGRRARWSQASPQTENAMKILYFDDFKLGILKGNDTVVDVSSVVRDIPHTGPHNLITGLIERFGDYRKRLEEAAAKGQGVPYASVKIRPPLPKPGNI